MVRKNRLTSWITVAVALLLLWSFVPAASADIAATVRTNKSGYKLTEVNVTDQLGVATKITLSVDQDTQVDAAFFQSKLEWLLDVRDMHGDRILPRQFGQNPGNDDPKPLPPAMPTGTLHAGEPYVVALLNLNEYYDIAKAGTYTVQLKLSLTTYDDGAKEHIVVSNVEKFVVWDVTTILANLDPDPIFQAKTPNWVTCYLSGFPSGFGPGDVDVSTVLLWHQEQSIPAEWGAIQGDVMMIKFSGSGLKDMALSPPKAEFKVTGRLSTYMYFQAFETVKIK